MKQLLIIFSLFFLIGCLPTTEQNNDVAATIVMPTPIIANVEPTLVKPTAPIDAVPIEPTEPPVPQPTAVDETNFAPIFHNIRFSTAPDAVPTAVFPAGTEEIFALWDYAHIPSNQPATMRRVWRFNGDAWLDREEVWDVADYGQEGTMTTISIYDFEGGGLASGNYDVELFLNGNLLLSGSFYIQGEGPAVAATDAFDHTVAAMNETELTLIGTDGRSVDKLLETDHPISEIVWVPNNRSRIIFVTRDTTEQIGGSGLGVKHALWLFELGSSNAVPLGFYDEDFHEVGVSDNGRYLSLIAGTSYGDACGVDRSFYIMQLNDEGQRTNLYELAQFHGVPRGQVGYLHDFYPANSGEWASPDHVTLEIRATCLTDEAIAEQNISPPGVYQLDIPQLSATRIDDLPSE